MISLQKLNLRASVLSTVLATTAFSPAFAASMQSAVQKAIAYHPNVKLAERNRDAIGHDINVAKAGYRPKIDFTAGTGYEHSNNTSTRNRAARTAGKSGDRDLWRNELRLTATQMIYDGFKTRSRVAQQENRHKSASHNVAETKEITALRAIEAYLNVLRTRELVALGEENFQTHVSYMQRIESRVDGGRGSQADVRQAQGRVALARANMIAFQGDLKKAEADYLEIVGEMPNMPTKPTTPFGLLPSSIEAAIARALTNSPAIQSAQFDIKAAKAEKAEAKCVYCPRVDLEAGASNNLHLDGVKGVNSDRYAMLMLRQNLYNGGADVARVKERTERVKEAEASLEQTRRLVEENVIQGWADMETSHNRITPLNEHVVAAKQSRDAYKDQFDLGQRTLLDLLDSEVELFNARNALINGKYSVDLAAYSILAQTGDLVAVVASSQQVASK